MPGTGTVTQSKALRRALKVAVEALKGGLEGAEATVRTV
jgi:hypothetical protein